MSVSWIDIVRFKLGLHQTKVGEEEWMAVLNKMEAEKNGASWKTKVMSAEQEIDESLWHDTLNRMDTGSRRRALWLYGSAALVSISTIAVAAWMLIGSPSSINQTSPALAAGEERVSSAQPAPGGTSQIHQDQSDNENPAFNQELSKATEVSAEEGIAQQEQAFPGAGLGLHILSPALKPASLSETEANPTTPPISPDEPEAASPEKPETEKPLSEKPEEVQTPLVSAKTDSAIAVKPEPSTLQPRKKSGNGWTFLAEAGVSGSRWQNRPVASTSAKSESIVESKSPYYQLSPTVNLGLGWNNWELRTGAQYSSLHLSGNAITKKNLVDSIPVYDTSGQLLFYFFTNYRDTLISNPYNGVISYWQLPLQISYLFELNERTRLNVGAGVVLGFTGKGRDSLNVPGPSLLKETNWSYTANVAVERQLKGPFSLTAGMYYQYQPESMFSYGSTLRSSFSNAGIQLKLKYSIPLQRKPHDP